MTLAEIEFGILLDEVATGAKNPRAALVLSNAQQYPIREITQHTAHEYADLRKNIAAHYLDVPSKRPRWIENWKDRVTGETLQIDENDLWICAQARETNLILITTDKKLVTRISPADPSSRFRLIRKD
jgi:predicted nucleic acid-binding protein